MLPSIDESLPNIENTLDSIDDVFNHDIHDGIFS